jgi:hypothetical protein
MPPSVEKTSEQIGDKTADDNRHSGVERPACRLNHHIVADERIGARPRTALREQCPSTSHCRAVRLDVQLYIFDIGENKAPETITLSKLSFKEATSNPVFDNGIVLSDAQRGDLPLLFRLELFQTTGCKN